jgi:hypothetical protein
MGTTTASPFLADDRTAARVLALCHKCVATGAWARLVFVTRGGNERIDFSCTNSLCMRAQGSKHPANTRRREWQKHRREDCVAKRKAATSAAVPAATSAAPASKQAAVAA